MKKLLAVVLLCGMSLMVTSAFSNGSGMAKSGNMSYCTWPVAC